MNDTTAQYITRLPCVKGVAVLLDLGATVTEEDGTLSYQIEGYVFFKAYPDSTTLYYEC